MPQKTNTNHSHINDPGHENSPGAYARGTNIVLFYKVGPHQMAHEIFHVVDFSLAETEGNLSSRQGWRDAINKDTCVAVEYANTS